MSNPFQFSLLWLLAYATVLGLVIGTMLYARQQAHSIYGTAKAQAQWDIWREDAKKLAEASPVKRRVPQSAEPPALVLMRDHFAACLAGAVLLTSVLFGTFMVLIRGALSQGRVELGRGSGRRPTTPS